MQRRRDSFDFDFLASELETARLPGGFESFRYGEIASVLVSAVEWQPSIPRGEHASLVHRAINSLGSKPIKAVGLRAALKAVQHQFLKSPTFPARLVATLAMDLSRLSIGQTKGQVRLSRRLPSAFVTARRSQDAQIPKDDQLPDGIW